MRAADFRAWVEVAESIKGWFVKSKERQVVQSGERTNAVGKPVRNKILLSASDGEYSSLRPHLEYVSLPNHRILHEAGGKISRIED